jgi:peptidoglycan/LPS O-acetylase OafA/YrhL
VDYSPGSGGPSISAPAGANRLAMTLVRTDIQALRGLAVLMVILYHMRIGSVDAGYLGVDVFFVISGYLITTLVATGIEKGNFTLGSFYFRRAKRLLPAAYVTVLVTALLSPWFLDREELHDFALQVVGAITFTANIFLWQQTGYFDAPSDLKPLLHVWSLSLEEQYYMLLPATLLLLPKRLWLRAVLFAMVASLGLWVVGGSIKPVATFYLLPSRAWELLIGSAGALFVLRRSVEEIGSSFVVRNSFFACLILLLVLPMFPLASRFPGMGAVLICFATVVVILRHHDRLENARITKLLAWVGDFSYSLYLVHWPIVALLKNAWVGSDAGLPLHLRFMALVLAFAAAYPLYRLVERPIHRAPFRYTGPLLIATIATSIALVSIAPVVMRVTKPTIDFEDVRRSNKGLGEACDYATNFEHKPDCSSAGNARVLVWGDSYAMHLVPGLLQQKETGGVIQATRSVCGPVLGLGPERLTNPEVGPSYDRAWAEHCIDFNESVLEFLRHDPSVKIVVMSSPMTQFVDADNWTHVFKSGDEFTVTVPNLDTTTRAFRETADALRAAGKRVILIAPPPTAGVDIGACLERTLTGLITIGGFKGCVIPMDAFHRRRTREIELVDSIEKAGIPVIRFADFLCEGATCRTYIDGTVIYRDQGHLTYDGARYLATKMNWAKLIDERAN